MMPYAILAAVTFLFIMLRLDRLIKHAIGGKVVGWFPLTVLVDRHDTYASNYATHIVIKRGIPKQAAIQCQERAEWGFKWKRGYFPVRLSETLHREMEYFGQTVELVVERDYGNSDWEKHLSATVLQLADPKYEQFRGVSGEQHRAALLATIPKAEAWVARHQSYVKRALRN